MASRCGFRYSWGTGRTSQRCIEEHIKPNSKPGRVTAKRPYRTPVLKIHGDFRKLTAAKGGNFNDGTGKPSTKKPDPSLRLIPRAIALWPRVGHCFSALVSPSSPPGQQSSDVAVAGRTRAPL